VKAQATTSSLRRAAALLLTLVLLTAPAGARAHAYPDHADPKVGSAVTGSPSQVRIWFDSALEPAFSSIAVYGPNGARVDPGHGGVAPSDPKLLVVDVPQLSPGTYRVTWSVVARDGHRTSGEYAFTIRT
jgi:methionine-rich copper-binding protein CopC